MAIYIVQKESLETVADSIRAKAGTTEKLEFPSGWKAAVENISGGSAPDGSAVLVKNVVNIYAAVSAEAVRWETVETNVPYTVQAGVWFVSSSIVADTSPAVTYYFPAKGGRRYTITMTEIGNILRVGLTTVDPATLKGGEIVSGHKNLTSSLEVGYQFIFTAPQNGWLLVYVSNQGERPTISVNEEMLVPDN